MQLLLSSLPLEVLFKSPPKNSGVVPDDVIVGRVVRGGAAEGMYANLLLGNLMLQTAQLAIHNIEEKMDQQAGLGKAWAGDNSLCELPLRRVLPAGGNGYRDLFDRILLHTFARSFFAASHGAALEDANVAWGA